MDPTWRSFSCDGEKFMVEDGDVEGVFPWFLVQGDPAGSWPQKDEFFLIDDWRSKQHHGFIGDVGKAKGFTGWRGTCMQNLRNEWEVSWNKMDSLGSKHDWNMW